jgi:TolB-like protein/Tfp pilus assembly protein PilF
MRRLFSSAKVRKLDRVAVGYLVAAWVVVQAGSIALPAFEAPAWSMKLLIAGAVVGLPLVLLIAWFWRIGEEPDEPADNASHPIWARSDLLLIGLLAFVLVTGAIELAFFLKPSATAQRSGNDAAASTAQASIAVLPFANLSGDPAKRYFSDGIADQLISELSRTPALRVASRTSSFALAQKDMDVKTLGKTLNVKTVLEGSVREEGGRVRIAAQLVSASDGFEVWSNTYDRNLTDILALQDEIAHSITQALAEHLLGKPGPAQQHPKPQSIAPDAYKDFLQGQYFFAQRTRSSIEHAIELFEKTTRAAPDFANGYAALADAHATIAFNEGEQNHIAPALYAVKQALAIDPDNITALAAHATVSLVQWKWLAAAQDVKRLQKLGPNNAQVWHNSSIFYAYMGLPDLAIAAAKRAVELDPLSFIDRSNLATFAISQGRYEEGIARARDALALQPGGIEPLGILCEVLAGAKRLNEARKVLTQIASLSDDSKEPGPRAACSFWIAANAGDKAEAKKVVDPIVATYPNNGVSAGDISTAYRFLGENDKALEWYIRALDAKDSAMLQVRYLGKGPREAFNTGPWLAVLKRPDVQAFQRARTKVASEFAPKDSGS